MRRRTKTVAAAAVIFLTLALGGAWHFGGFNDLPRTSPLVAGQVEEPSFVADAPNFVERPDWTPADYPRLRNSSYSFTDSSTVYGELPLRTFDVPLGDKSIKVTATYRRFLEDPDLSLRITHAANHGAGFSEAFRKDIVLPDSDAVVALHVGDFAQDYCGELDVIYTLERDGVFAVTGTVAQSMPLLDGMACERSRKQDSPYDFCERRINCVGAFLRAKPDDEILELSLGVAQALGAMRFE